MCADTAITLLAKVVLAVPGIRAVRPSPGWWKPPTVPSSGWADYLGDVSDDDWPVMVKAAEEEINAAYGVTHRCGPDRKLPEGVPVEEWIDALKRNRP